MPTLNFFERRQSGVAFLCTSNRFADAIFSLARFSIDRIYANKQAIGHKNAAAAAAAADAPSQSSFNDRRRLNSFFSSIIKNALTRGGGGDGGSGLGSLAARSLGVC